MAEPKLSVRALNRATLARQFMLKREKTTPVKAIEHLVGLQAQLARPPFIGLWSRIAGFARQDLTRAIEQRVVLRATMMRCTLHLFSARDYRSLRPAIAPVLERAMTGVLRERADALDLPRLKADAAAYFAEPRTFEQLRTHLVAKHPKHDERAMGYAVRCHVPLVQVPVAGSDWAYPGNAPFTLADAWLDAPIDGASDAEQLVLRYLAAFGPATAADAQTWSGLRGLKPTFEALRPKLRSLRDEQGRELFDLPKAPRPAEDTAAPVRFLPEFDNLVLGHDDRTRLIADADRRFVSSPNLQVPATFLVDGFVAGTWKAQSTQKIASLTLAPFRTLTKATRDELAAEGEALLSFVEPAISTRDICFAKRAEGAPITKRRRESAGALPRLPKRRRESAGALPRQKQR